MLRHSRSRPPARLTPDFIRVVSQSIPELPAVKPEVEQLLAQDAEYYIREVIHRAKGHMRHSKCTTLTSQHIMLAEKDRTHQPTPGYGSLKPLSFDSVPDVPGLFITHDSIIALNDVLLKNLPPVPPAPSVMSAWRFIRNGDGLVLVDDGPHFSHRAEPTSPSNQLARPLQTLSQAVSTCLSTHSASIATSAFLHTTLRQLTTATNIPYQKLTHQIRVAVHKHARPGGKMLVLDAAMRMIRALHNRSDTGIASWTDALMSTVLTCLAGRSIRDRTIRQRAAAALTDMMRSDGFDTLVHARVAKTLALILTDQHVGLGCVFGAVTGLAVLGGEAFQIGVMPHVAALLSGLE